MGLIINHTNQQRISITLTHSVDVQLHGRTWPRKTLWLSSFVS